MKNRVSFPLTVYNSLHAVRVCDTSSFVWGVRGVVSMWLCILHGVWDVQSTEERSVTELPPTFCNLQGLFKLPFAFSPRRTAEPFFVFIRVIARG